MCRNKVSQYVIVMNLLLAKLAALGWGKSFASSCISHQEVPRSCFAGCVCLVICTALVQRIDTPASFGAVWRSAYAFPPPIYGRVIKPCPQWWPSCSCCWAAVHVHHLPRLLAQLGLGAGVLERPHLHVAATLAVLLAPAALASTTDALMRAVAGKLPPAPLCAPPTPCCLVSPPSPCMPFHSCPVQAGCG